MPGLKLLVASSMVVNCGKEKGTMAKSHMKSGFFLFTL